MSGEIRSPGVTTSLVDTIYSGHTKLNHGTLHVSMRKDTSCMGDSDCVSPSCLSARTREKCPVMGNGQSVQVANTCKYTRWLT